MWACNNYIPKIKIDALGATRLSEPYHYVTTNIMNQFKIQKNEDLIS